MDTLSCAILGSGNIGTDLMYKLQDSGSLDVAALVGVDPDSKGLARARTAGVETSVDGVDWIVDHADEIDLVFEATSAAVHSANAPLLAKAGLPVIDLTPAAIGPPVVPVVNLAEHLDAPNVNMITCGGQAATPIVHAVSRAAAVPYAEMVSAIASLSAGAGTRQNIDEFTQTTRRGLELIGGADLGKAIIILNPAEPAVLMRNTVYCALSEDADEATIEASILAMVDEVRAYVPGYRLLASPLFDDGPFATPTDQWPRRVTVLLEVEGAGHFLPAFAGNLDIMTAAAKRVGEMKAAARRNSRSS